MTSWLFVAIQGNGMVEPQTKTDIHLSELKSHATRFAHARNRQKRLKALKGSLVRFSDPEPTVNAQPAKATLSAGHRKLIPRASNSNDQDEVAYHPHPVTTLVRKSEPFCSHRLDQLAPIMRHGLEYAYEVLWPRNSPVLQGDKLRKTIDAWRSNGLMSPLVFCSQVSNAASLCLAMATDPAAMRTLSSIRILYQTQAIQLIQETVNQLVGPASSALITCIMNVHGQGAQMYEPFLDQSIPESPIFKGFNLKLYGRFAPPRVHLPALIALLRERGGLVSLPTGVAEPMQLADICGANMALSEPNFPLLPSMAEVADQEKDNYDYEATRLLETLGTGFDHVLHGAHGTLTRLLVEACRLIAAIDEYQRDTTSKYPLHILAVKSISFQHRLLSISTAKRGNEKLEDSLFHITRIATFIFSDYVFFPTAEARQGRGRLADLLKNHILSYFRLQSEEYVSFTNSDNLALWALFMGGIASSNTGNRQWYVMQIFEHVFQRHLTWIALQEILGTFLYYDYVLETPVTNLWVEVFQSLQTGGRAFQDCEDLVLNWT